MQKDARDIRNNVIASALFAGALWSLRLLPSGGTVADFIRTFWPIGAGAVCFYVLFWVVPAVRAFLRDYRQLRQWVRGRYYVTFWAWLETDAGRDFKGIAESSPDGLIGAWEAWNRWKEGQRATP